MGLRELVDHCKTLNYTPVHDKNEWDYIYESIWIALHNPVQEKTLFILAKMFYPIKLISKTLLKSYALFLTKDGSA